MLQALGVFPTSKGEVDKKGFLVFREAIELQQPLSNELGTHTYMHTFLSVRTCILYIHAYIHWQIIFDSDTCRNGYRYGQL